MGWRVAASMTADLTLDALEQVEFASLEWGDWFNNRRLLEPIGNVPPIEFEATYYDTVEAPATVAGLA